MVDARALALIGSAVRVEARENHARVDLGQMLRRQAQPCQRVGGPVVHDNVCRANELLEGGAAGGLGARGGVGGRRTDVEEDGALAGVGGQAVEDRHLQGGEGVCEMRVLLEFQLGGRRRGFEGGLGSVVGSVVGGGSWGIWNMLSGRKTKHHSPAPVRIDGPSATQPYTHHPKIRPPSQNNPQPKNRPRPPTAPKDIPPTSGEYMRRSGSILMSPAKNAPSIRK